MGIGGVLNKGAHFMGKIMSSPAANAFFVAQGFSGMVRASADTAFSAVQDTTSLDPNTAERFGRNMGTLGSEMVSTGYAAAWLNHALATKGAIHDEAFRYALPIKQNGVKVGEHAMQDYYQQGGKMFSASGKAVASKEAEIIKEHGLSGVIGRKGNFIKNAGWKLGIGTIAAPIVANALLSPTLGFVGKLIDEQYQMSRRAREMQYDDRYIVNQQQDMSTYQQVGAAMNSYENRAVSMSRIYHSR